MKIVVLAGGLSLERDVSLVSGVIICNTLRKLGHQAVFVDIFIGIDTNKNDLEKLFIMNGSNIQLPVIKMASPDIESIKKVRHDKFASELGPNVIELCKMADICYMGVHGGIGENGMLQAILDVNGIKYTGTDSLSSALAMHKGISKQLFRSYNVPCANGFILKKCDKIKSLSEHLMNFPVVVKVCSCGSSIGVYIAKNEVEYEYAIKKCFEIEDEVLVETYIKGREFAVPIIGGKVYPVIEIVPRHGWFDYEHKYQKNMTDEICPAYINYDICDRIKNVALAACEALGIMVYSRVDILLDSNNNIYCLEVNTLPGMTPESLLPKSVLHVGISYEDLCQLILEESLKKYGDK